MIAYFHVHFLSVCILKEAFFDSLKLAELAITDVAFSGHNNQCID